ncbi:MAG: hypothetical protein SGPRY_011204 [Prymnesium sp.]
MLGIRTLAPSRLPWGYARHLSRSPYPNQPSTHKHTPAPDVSGSAYTILNVPRDADENAVKRAYYRLAKVWHPDVSRQRDADAIFAHIISSHEILRDPEQRVIYDFVLEHSNTLHRPGEFQNFYSRAKELKILFKYRHELAWMLLATIAAIPIALRVRQMLKPIIKHPDKPFSITALLSLVSSSAACAAPLVQGATGIVGALRVAFAALSGAILGRFGGILIEKEVGQLQLAQEQISVWLVSNSRPLCEAYGAAAAGLLTMRTSTLPFRELHFQIFRFGALGALVGHVASRMIVFSSEMAPTNLRSAEPPNTPAPDGTRP